MPTSPDDAAETGAKPRGIATTETHNRLRALPPAELDRLRPALQTVRMEYKQDLYEADRPINHVWFPHVGVASMLSEAPEGRPVEIATVGNEGFVGVPLLLGAETRCARWLLMTHDRVNGDKHFPLTQEFLARMLGVRRASVSVAQAMLQRAGLIRYTRGTISVLDRAGLEAASCGCYRIIRADHDRLLP